MPSSTALRQYPQQQHRPFLLCNAADMRLELLPTNVPIFVRVKLLQGMIQGVEAGLPDQSSDALTVHVFNLLYFGGQLLLTDCTLLISSEAFKALPEPLECLLPRLNTALERLLRRRNIGSNLLFELFDLMLCLLHDGGWQVLRLLQEGGWQIHDRLLHLFCRLLTGSLHCKHHELFPRHELFTMRGDSVHKIQDFVHLCLFEKCIQSLFLLKRGNELSLARMTLLVRTGSFEDALEIDDCSLVRSHLCHNQSLRGWSCWLLGPCGGAGSRG